MRRHTPRDVELWAPVPFQTGNRITLQHRMPNADPYCIMLTLKQATALGLRLIRCAAIKEREIIWNKLRESTEKKGLR